MYTLQVRDSVALTRLLSPGGSETPEKLVGTIFLRILKYSGQIEHPKMFGGSPEEVILQAIDRTAELIERKLSSS